MKMAKTTTTEVGPHPLVFLVGPPREDISQRLPIKNERLKKILRQDAGPKRANMKQGGAVAVGVPNAILRN